MSAEDALDPADDPSLYDSQQDTENEGGLPTDEEPDASASGSEDGDFAGSEEELGPSGLGVPSDSGHDSDAAAARTGGRQGGRSRDGPGVSKPSNRSVWAMLDEDTDLEDSYEVGPDSPGPNHRDADTKQVRKAFAAWLHSGSLSRRSTILYSAPLPFSQLLQSHVGRKIGRTVCVRMCGRCVCSGRVASVSWSLTAPMTATTIP